MAKACLYNCNDAVVLVLNKNKLKDTGAWVAFFDLGLNEGKGESFLDLKKVDYKIEAGQLYRYTASFGERWTPIQKLSSYQIDSWLVLPISKQLFANHLTTLSWRVALFPSAGEPSTLRLPASGPASLDLSKELNCKAFRGEGLPLDVMLATSFHPELKLIPFCSGDNFELNLSSFPPLDTPFMGIDDLVQPYPNTLFIGAQKNEQALSRDIEASHQVKDLVAAIVFDLPQLSSREQNEWLNQARCHATRVSGKKPFFVFDQQTNLPHHLAGAILKWEGDLQKIYEHLKQLNTPAPLWYFYNPEHPDMNVTTQKASQKIKTEFNLLPMLTPNYSFENCSHELYTDVLWKKLCLLYKTQQAKPDSTDPLMSMKHKAPEQYAKKVFELMSVSLNSNNISRP